jgi:hypothetical protein
MLLRYGSALALPPVRRWVEASRRSTLSLTLRTTAPVDNLGLVDLVAQVVSGCEAGGEADRAVDVDHTAADATNQVMVVVIDPVLVEGG